MQSRCGSAGLFKKWRQIVYNIYKYKYICIYAYTLFNKVQKTNIYLFLLCMFKFLYTLLIRNVLIVFGECTSLHIFFLNYTYKVANFNIAMNLDIIPYNITLKVTYNKLSL